MMFSVVMKAGSVSSEMYSNLSYEEAVEICEYYEWQVSPDGGFVWDLEIEEREG